MEYYSQERAQIWLETHWSTPKRCPICDTNDWSVSETLVAHPLSLPDTIARLSGHVVPVFLVTCAVCGYTMTFNARVAGSAHYGD